MTDRVPLCSRCLRPLADGPGEPTEAADALDPARLGERPVYAADDLVFPAVTRPIRRARCHRCEAEVHVLLVRPEVAETIAATLAARAR